VDVRKAREKELKELKKRVNEELASLKTAKFGGRTDREFEEATGVSRASLPGVETGRSWLRLDSMYLWVVGCGSTLAELFRSPSGEYDDNTRDLHRNLEFILKTQGTDHWVGQAIQSEYSRLRPPARVIRGSPVSPNAEAVMGSRRRKGSS
jgi:transcriptional regulator with XRE-family HTH domain